MRILGIDPGIATVGFGVVDSEKGKLNYVSCGIISTPAKTALSSRLDLIYNDLNQLFETFKPDVVCIEELFFNTNNTTAIPVAEARGVLIVGAKEYTNRLFEYTPLQIKQALTGNGRAEKKQVQYMVKNILGLSEMPKPDDAADAIAIALCHARSSTSLLARLKRED